MDHKLRETGIHLLAATIAWSLTHSLASPLFKDHENRRIVDDAREALVRSATHAISVTIASLIVRRVLS